MKINKVKIVQADPAKRDYICAVKDLLNNHDASNHNMNQFEKYGERAGQLLGPNPDKEKLLVMLLSA